jgi:uncharacterized membrane protein YhaH (DUF805 family)
MWHDWFIHWTLELVRQCGIIGFSIEHWNCSDHVALFVFLLDFGTLPTMGTAPKYNKKTNNITMSD